MPDPTLDVEKTVALLNELAAEREVVSRVYLHHPPRMAEFRADAERLRSLASQLPALLSSRSDAERYQFLRPHLEIDGDVDDLDMASRSYNWLTLKNERVMLCDGFGTDGIDAEIDKAMRAANRPSEEDDR